MNSKSSNDFQWSVSLTSNRNIYTGIVAHFRSHCWIERGDANAIIFDSFDGKIFKGSTVIQKNNIKPQCGDVIHFRFQPKLKKFAILFVSSINQGFHGILIWMF